MKYIVTSDIHLGHIRTPNIHIINSFKKYILSDKNKDIDILFIAGDMFDRLLDLNSKEVHEVIDLFNNLLTYCYTNDILLRVLEGTPSHDWQQCELLIKLNEIRVNKCNLKYFKYLDIEYIQPINKYVLYIPDEWCSNHEDLENQITQKLSQYNISQVDIAILHGQFKYQLIGKKYNGFFFKEEYFLKLVKEYIHVGHYHIFSSFDRIIANGSLERLAHGEEKPKGYVLVEDDKYSFIENTDSYTYVTLNITNSTTLDKLDKLIYKFNKNSFIRLLVPKDHVFNINFTDLKLRYLDYNLKKIIKENLSDKSSITYILTDSDQLEYFDNTILNSSLYTTLVENITSKNKLSESELNKLYRYLEVFKNTSEEINLEQNT